MLRSIFIRPRQGNSIIRLIGERDKHLGAIKNKVIALFGSHSPGCGSIRSGIRLCYTIGKKQFSFGQFRQVMLLLLLVPAMQYHIGAVHDDGIEI